MSGPWEKFKAPEVAASTGKPWEKFSSPSPAPQAAALDAASDDSPDGSVDKPLEADLFGSDGDRVKSSFGDMRGVGRMLVKNGYLDFKKNKDGDLVAKDARGLWHKDAQGWQNPINWAEGHLGKALPLAGGIAGGSAAGLAASPTGPGAIAAGAAGAAAGGAAGEGARIGIGKGLGVYDGGAGDIADDVGTEGALMGLGDGVLRVLPIAAKAAAPYAKPLMEPIAKAAGPIVDGARTLGRKAVAKTSSLLSGVPSEAVEQLIQHPNSVLNPSKSEYANEVAKSLEGVEQYSAYTSPNAKAANGIVASDAFDNPGPNHFRHVMTTMLGATGMSHHSPGMMALGAALQPGVHKQVIGRSAQAMERLPQMFANNPWMTKTLANPKLREYMERMTSQAADEDKGYTPSKEPLPEGAAQKSLVDGT